MKKNTAFPNEVRAIRQQRGWSLQKLAERMDSDKAYLSRVERGLHRPTLENQLRILKALGVAKSRRTEVFPWAR